MTAEQRFDDLPRPLAFVLSGGSNLGAAQVGMLRGLRRAGVQPDLLVGSSVGALNALMVAADPDEGVDRLTDVWLRLGKRDVFPSRLITKVARLAWTRSHLEDPRGIRSLIEDNVIAEVFEDLAVPLGVVATDIRERVPVTITDGTIVDAILASTAIPGIFPPVVRNGRQLFDGGVIANLPVWQAVELGAESLVVLDAGAPPYLPGEAKGFGSAISLATSLLLRHQPEAHLAGVQPHVPTIVLPHTDGNWRRLVRFQPNGRADVCGRRINVAPSRAQPRPFTTCADQLL